LFSHSANPSIIQLDGLFALHGIAAVEKRTDDMLLELGAASGCIGLNPNISANSFMQTMSLHGIVYEQCMRV
jgi:hypothetical protein